MHTASCTLSGSACTDHGLTALLLIVFDVLATPCSTLYCPQADPCSFASGGDDGVMRLWSLRQPGPTACVDARANVCSVQWSPTDPHLLAFSSANYCAFVYDRRQVSQSLQTLCHFKTSLVVCCCCAMLLVAAVSVLLSATVHAACHVPSTPVLQQWLTPWLCAAGDPSGSAVWAWQGGELRALG